MQSLDLRYLAIALAVAGAFALAFGAQFQNDAVGKRAGHDKTRPGALNLKELFQLIRHPQWLSGTAMIGGALVLQLGALSLAPLIVVQPIGAIALVITSLLNARISKTKLNRATWMALSLCLAGVGLFVWRTSSIAKDVKLSDGQLWQVLGLLVVILAVISSLFFTLGKRMKALSFIVGAGVLYGFVATLTKVIIQRIYQGEFEWITVLCALALIGATTLGGWFVQNAYASGPPDLVIAGLTVVDPMVAVLIGVIVLGEADKADFWSFLAMGAAGAIAVTGVWMLSKVHPEIVAAEKRLAALAKRKNIKL